MAIPTTSSTFEVSRSTTPGEVSSLKGNAHNFTFTLPGGNTYDSYDTLTFQIHKRGLAGTGNTLVSQTTTDPTGTSQTFAVSDSNLSLEVAGARAEYGMVLYGMTAGASDKLWIGKLYLYAHHASSDASPSTPALYLTIAEADTLYEPLGGGGGGASFVTFPLSPAFADTRGTQGSHSYDSATGILYIKVTSSPDPDVWVGWQTFNQV